MEYTLGSLVSILGGKRLPQGADYADEKTNHPYIRVTDFADNSVCTENLKYVSEATAHKIQRYTISSQDVYISIAGTIGLVGTIPQSLDGAQLTENAAKVVIKDPTLLDKNYLVTVLSSPFCQDQIKSKTMNTSQPKLALFRIGEIIIPLPQIAEQIHIANVISRIDNLISLRKQQLAKLDELVKARFVEMFGDSDKSNILEPLSNYLEYITYGFTNPMPDAEDGPWKVTAKDVVDGQINFSTARKTSFEAFDNLSQKSRPVLGSILLTKDGTLGRVAIVENENICVNQSVAVLKCNERVIPQFLMRLLQMPNYQQEMLANSGGGTIKHIYITKVDKMPIAVPDITLQKEFIHFAEQTNKFRLTIQQGLDRLELLKKALMRECFG